MKIEYLLALTIALLSCAAQAVTAQDHDHNHPHGHDHQHGPIAVMPAQMYAPTAMPDRIILTLNEDPKTTQTVNWRTSVDVATALVEIAEAGAGPKFVEKKTQHVAKSAALKSDLNTAHYHNYTFRGLKPGTTYAYRVGDGINWSEWFHFQTAPVKDSKFSFVYFGDAQNSVRSLWSRVIRKAYQDAPKAAFILHAGDLINHADADAEWGEWFGAGGWLNAMTPSIAIPGNHEHVKVDGVRRDLSEHWRKVFTFPENGPRGLEETCFTLTYQNLRIIGLNSMTMHEEQAAWLDGVLAANESEWVVCTFHHPIFSAGKDRDNSQLRALWKPILDKYKVDLVLQGHDHTYGRTQFKVPGPNETREEFEAAAKDGDTQMVVHENSATGKQFVDEKTGTIYVVSVSGPKMYDSTRFEFMKRVAEDTQLYQIIHIDGDKLRFEARTAIGELYDAFELKKQDGDINKLIEIEPEVPQNLRPLEVKKVSASSIESEVLITAVAETEAVSAGVDDDAADDAAIWYNYDIPTESLVIGTNKKSGVNVYDLQGKRIRSYEVGKVNNIDVRQGIFDSVDLVGASNRSTLAMDFWLVQKETQTLKSIGSIASKLDDIYGFCLATNTATKEVYAFANSKTGKVEQWKLSRTSNGIEGELVRELQLQSQVEGMVADDELGRLYVGVEEAGVYRFELPAKGSTDGTLIEKSDESNSKIKFDIEGLSIFEQPDGKGYLIASIQGNNSYAVFKRDGNNAYVSSFKIVDGNVDGVQETDGIQVTSLPLGADYPKGIFICQDGVNIDSDKHMPQNFKYVSWELIAKKLGLDRPFADVTPTKR